VKTAPLPAGAQFLNVIESVFSGMAKGIIHNSDYPSAEAAKNAIDRYFQGAERPLCPVPEARRTKNLGTGAGAKRVLRSKQLQRSAVSLIPPI
jgi:hypothetical protein